MSCCDNSVCDFASDTYCCSNFNDTCYTNITGTTSESYNTCMLYSQSKWCGPTFPTPAPTPSPPTPVPTPAIPTPTPPTPPTTPPTPCPEPIDDPQLGCYYACGGGNKLCRCTESTCNQCVEIFNTNATKITHDKIDRASDYLMCQARNIDNCREQASQIYEINSALDPFTWCGSFTTKTNICDTCNACGDHFMNKCLTESIWASKYQHMNLDDDSKTWTEAKCNKLTKFFPNNYTWCGDKTPPPTPSPTVPPQPYCKNVDGDYCPGCMGLTFNDNQLTESDYRSCYGDPKKPGTTAWTKKTCLNQETTQYSIQSHWVWCDSTTSYPTFACDDSCTGCKYRQNNLCMTKTDNILTKTQCDNLTSHFPDYYTWCGS